MSACRALTLFRDTSHDFALRARIDHLHRAMVSLSNNVDACFAAALREDNEVRAAADSLRAAVLMLVALQSDVARASLNSVTSPIASDMLSLRDFIDGPTPASKHVDRLALSRAYRALRSRCHRAGGQMNGVTLHDLRVAHDSHSLDLLHVYALRMRSELALSVDLRQIVSNLERRHAVLTTLQSYSVLRTRVTKGQTAANALLLNLIGAKARIVRAAILGAGHAFDCEAA